MIPITVVTGFLGAGKTSLVAHLLDSTPDRRIAVVVNDMAPRSIDGAYLRGGEFLDLEDDELIRSIPGGRVGAGKGDALVEQILAIVAEDPRPDTILIETSGGSPMLTLAGTLAHDPTLAEVVRLDSVVTVVDTAMLGDWWRDGALRPVVRDQISSADLVVLNKYDRASIFQRMRARWIVKSVRRGIPLIAAEYGRLDPADVIDTGRHEKTPPVEHHPRSNPNHYPLVARQLEEVRPFHPERLDQWLNAEWPGIIRIKGFAWIATDMDHVYVVDAAGSQRELGLEGTWYGALPPEELPKDIGKQRLFRDNPYKDRRQSLTVIGVPEAVEREMRNLRGALLSATEMDRGHQAWASLPDPIAPLFLDDDEQPAEEPQTHEPHETRTPREPNEPRP